MKKWRGLGLWAVATGWSLVAASAQAWEVHRSSQAGDAYTLSGNDSSPSELRDVVSAESGRLEGIFLGRLVKVTAKTADADALQADILNHLRQKHPGALESALRSAGNPHNPKMVALHPAFEEALLRSRYIAAIDSALQEAGYRAAGVGTEKFFLLKDDAKGVRFDALIWLKVAPAASPQVNSDAANKADDSISRRVTTRSDERCTQSVTQQRIEVECRDVMERKQQNAVNEWETDLPSVLKALHQLPSSDFGTIDYEPLDHFHSPQDNRTWFQAWTGNSEVDGAQFKVFAEDGTGGYTAFWLVRPGGSMDEQPIVFLGSEGARGVVARNLDEYLWLLAGGVGPQEAVEHGGQGARPIAILTAFAKANSRVSPMSVDEVLRHSKASYPDFSAYIDGLCR